MIAAFKLRKLRKRHKVKLEQATLRESELARASLEEAASDDNGNPGGNSNGGGGDGDIPGGGGGNDDAAPPRTLKEQSMGWMGKSMRKTMGDNIRKTIGDGGAEGRSVSRDTPEKCIARYSYYVLLVSYFICPAVSTVIFSTFVCTSVDDNDPTQVLHPFPIAHTPCQMDQRISSHNRSFALLL